MVVNLCGLRLGPTPSRSTEKDPKNEKCGLTASVVKFLKPRSSCTAMKATKRPVVVDQGNSKANVTLKDWMAASTSSRAGECEMGVHKQSSRKIHPSFDGEIKEELLVECGKRGKEEGNSGKGKEKVKKVSFRSPEVAQVFVLERYSPEMYVCVEAQ